MLVRPQSLHASGSVYEGFMCQLWQEDGIDTLPKLFRAHFPDCYIHDFDSPHQPGPFMENSLYVGYLMGRYRPTSDSPVRKLIGVHSGVVLGYVSLREPLQPNGTARASMSYPVGQDNVIVHGDLVNCVLPTGEEMWVIRLVDRPDRRIRWVAISWAGTLPIGVNGEEPRKFNSLVFNADDFYSWGGRLETKGATGWFNEVSTTRGLVKTGN